jgi:hypothetical protein
MITCIEEGIPPSLYKKSQNASRKKLLEKSLKVRSDMPTTQPNSVVTLMHVDKNMILVTQLFSCFRGW